MCNLLLALALSTHLSYVGLDKTNNIHPHVGIECHNIMSGVYYNSEYRISPYIGYKFQLTPKQRIDAIIATGYEKPYSTLPLIRYKNRIFFISPSVVAKTLVDDPELEILIKNYYPSVVIGIEIGKYIL